MNTEESGFLNWQWGKEPGAPRIKCEDFQNVVLHHTIASEFPLSRHSWVLSSVLRQPCRTGVGEVTEDRI